jgi:S-adenosylmethionine synthetase
MLAQDPNSRVACETFCTTGLVTIMGEITTKADVDVTRIARQTIKEIGYDRAKYGFDADTCGIMTAIHEQSADIALGVDNSAEVKSGESENDHGAGDQGLMFGYACNETKELMPLPISLAHKLAMKLTAVRKDGALPYLRPDGKTQITIEYVDGKPVRVEAIVVSSQHSADVTLETIRKDIIDKVILPIVPIEMIDDNTKIFVNPTGRFVIGGPNGDTGLTGRKIIVDTYGGYSRHGGGAFSGKDPTKVDRSAFYAARYVAKNIVASGVADKCEVQIAYAIGVAKPVSVLVDTFGTARVDEDKISEYVYKNIDLHYSNLA